MKRAANLVENRFKQFSSKLTNSSRLSVNLMTLKNVPPSENRFEMILTRRITQLKTENGDFNPIIYTKKYKIMQFDLFTKLLC